MASQKQNIAFLRDYIRQRSRWLEMSRYLSQPDADLGVQTEQQLMEYKAEEEQAAKIVRDHGLDARPFRDYLTPDENPLSRREIRMLRKRIQIAAQCLDGMEAAEEDKNSIVVLKDIELTVLTDMASNEGKCRSRKEISAAAGVSETSLKSILPKFEKIGLIARPYGIRSGYTITNAGMKLSKKVSPEKNSPQQKQ